MFTGIIEHLGGVMEIRDTSYGKRLKIELGPLVENLREGHSVSVNGLCLTVCSIDSSVAEFDVMVESLDRSTFSSLRAGKQVNLERALGVDGRFEGHIVQGHVDGTGTVRSVRRGGRWTITFTADRRLVDQMAPKGSVAIDGVSLTLTEAEGETFSVALVPTTLGATTLKDLTVGAKVNVEVDILGKYVRRYLREMMDEGAPELRDSLTLEKLREAGFA